MKPIPRLHLISDSNLCPLDRFIALSRVVVAAGVEAMHLREKTLPAGELLAAAITLREALGGSAMLLINDRIDVALLSYAGGVQLGEGSLPVAGARTFLPPGVLIGRSVHDVTGALRAAEDSADFVIAGHVYETASKSGQAARGTEFVESIASAVSIPVIAIGGITPERVHDVMRAGAYGVAVQSGILAAPDPQAAARRYMEAINGAG